MFEPFEKTGNKAEDDKTFLQVARTLRNEGLSFIEHNAAVSNIIALLNWYLEDINWVGVYYLDEGSLIVGPFQGQPACERIAMGRGVCGTVASTQTPIAVPDVKAFAGHIACSSQSKSEIVCPIHDRRGNLTGVLDLDSPLLGRFSDADIPFFMEVSSLLSK